MSFTAGLMPLLSILFSTLPAGAAVGFNRHSCGGCRADYGLCIQQSMDRLFPGIHWAWTFTLFCLYRPMPCRWWRPSVFCCGFKTVNWRISKSAGFGEICCRRFRPWSRCCLTCWLPALPCWRWRWASASLLLMTSLRKIWRIKPLSALFPGLCTARCWLAITSLAGAQKAIRFTRPAFLLAVGFIGSKFVLEMILGK